MSLDFDLEILRRGDTHIIVARQYGVVVRTRDLAAGLQEAEARIAAVAADLQEAGIASGPELQGKAWGSQGWSQLAISLAPSITVAAVLSTLLLVASLPLVNAAASLRNTLNGIMPAAPTDSVDAAGRAGINYLTRLGNAVEQLTPERKEELKTAVRKIAIGLRPVLDEARSATICSDCTTPEGRR